MTAATRALVALVLLVAALSAQQKKDILHDQTALLRRCPKHFVEILSIDHAKRSLELRVEGESAARSFVLTPDAEVKVHDWWGRTQQLGTGDRAWIWMLPRQQGVVDRIFVLADELSEQRIHGLPYEVTAIDTAGQSLTLSRSYGKAKTQERKLSLHEKILVKKRDGGFVVAPRNRGLDQPNTPISTGTQVFAQTAGGKIRLVLTAGQMNEFRRAQRFRMNAEFREQGLPATVAVNHRFAGEVELLVDHEAMRWARHQEPGARVTLMLDKPLPGVVREVRAFHEKTRLLIAVAGPPLAAVRGQQRVRVKVPTPPDAVLTSKLPAAIGRAKGRAARIDWFLANSYCSCSISGDGCTGMYYTLASCHTKRCGMPNRIRGFVGARIDKGLTDVQIWAELVAERGRACTVPHLLK